MNKLIIILFVSSFATFSFAAEFGEDPYKAIEHFTLENGMKVFLAPSEEATTTAIHLEVAVGWEAESKGEYGISHLLEHVLFRDKQLKDEMTYLQLIREAGGQANGSTNRRATSYFGSIPAKKGLWLLQHFGKMILEPSITPEYVQKEKGTVELEIGRPGPISETLGFNPKDYIYPAYLNGPSFWESEFGVTFEANYTTTEEQLSNRNIEVAQLVRYYADWYHPENMKLFIAGKFNKQEILAEINKRWATLPKVEGKKLAAEQPPTPAERPYVRRILWQETPYVYLGTKAWDLEYKDTTIAAVYLEYLSHRLMKEIRNLKGQTYSASEWTSFSRGFGYAGIQFQTPREHLKENIAIAKEYIQQEAREGMITEANMKEAIKMYLSAYQLMGRDAEKMMGLAKEYANVSDEYGSFHSPFATLEKMTLADYVKSLQATFNEKHQYETIYTPPLLFVYDIYVLYFLVALVSFFGLRKYFTNAFAHDRLRWVRKIKYPPVKLLEAAGLVIAYFGIVHFQMVLGRVFTSSQFIQSHLLLSNYLYGTVWMFTSLLVAQGVYALMPRKLMVVDDNLMIKSVTYYSKLIPLKDIKKVEAIRGITRPFAFKLWFKEVNLRYFYVNPRFWQKGLLIQLHNGKSYYFSVNEPETVCKELSGFLSAQTKDSEQTSQVA